MIWGKKLELLLTCDKLEALKVFWTAAAVG